MHYRDRLRRWAVVRLLPNLQRITIARFVRQSDADGYVQVLRLLEPDAKLIVIFDPIDPSSDHQAE